MILPLRLSAGEDSTTAEGRDGVQIRRSVLPGGIRVLTESVPGARSASIGAWVPVGSRDEVDGHYGSTHFLEHLLFKGTSSRSALQIAEAFDRVGGEANAATGKEHTCYYARVLDSDVAMATEVISDMITSATLDRPEFEIERGVICEELAMNGDDPTDVAHEAFAAAVFGASPLARPIGGTVQTISDVPRDAVWEHYRQHYVSQNLVVTAAGSIDHDRLCDQLLADLPTGGWQLAAGVAPSSRRPVVPAEQLPLEGSHTEVTKSWEQANVIVGSLALPAADDRRFVLSVLNAILGGGMSSRLFQEVRERRGLAYAVYSFATSHADAGAFGMYAGCAPGAVDQVVEVMTGELERLATDGVAAAELERGIGQLSGSLVLGLEDSASRMSRLGRAEIVTGELLDIDETLARVHAVQAEQVRELAQQLASAPRHVVVAGPPAP